MIEHTYRDCGAIGESAYNAAIIEQHEREQMSKNALRMFVKASVLEPASVTAQGAMIASLFQEAGLRDPQLSGMCLVDDAEKIDRLVEKAKAMHAFHNNDVIVTDDYMRGVIKRDFFIAEKLIDFSPEDIQYILNDLKVDIRNKKLSEDSYLKRALEVPSLGRNKLPASLGRIVIDLVR